MATEGRLSSGCKAFLVCIYCRLRLRRARQSVQTKWATAPAGRTSHTRPGLNFAYYVPGQVERVEAIEPDATMLRFARNLLAEATVPITPTQAYVDELPFPDATFDSAVATLVWCSVPNPARGLREVRRVLKPGGKLLLLEHVRATGTLVARVQDLLTPLTTRLFGNCHWNRDTTHVVSEAGFHITSLRQERGRLQPVIVLLAQRT